MTSLIHRLMRTVETVTIDVLHKLFDNYPFHQFRHETYSPDTGQYLFKPSFHCFLIEGDMTRGIKNTVLTRDIKILNAILHR